MVAIDHTSCGPCANVICSQYGCQKRSRIADLPDGYAFLGCGECGHEIGICQSQGCRKHRHNTLNWPSLAQQGCICPPTSEQTCMSATCPRKPRT
jgi:hypothetical protein